MGELCVQPDKGATSGDNCIWSCTSASPEMDLFGGEPQLEHELILVACLNRYKSLLALQHFAVTSDRWEGTVGLSKGNPNIQVSFLSHLPGSDSRCFYRCFCCVAWSALPACRQPGCSSHHSRNHLERLWICAVTLIQGIEAPGLWSLLPQQCISDLFALLYYL